MRAKVGDVAQVAQVRPFRYDDGPEAGTKALDIRMAGGVHAVVLADRGMDLGPVWVDGHPLGWISGTGPAHPAYGSDADWLRLYHGGLMVTAGLENVGLPCEDDGVSHGLHGRISVIPARNVHWHVPADDPNALEVVGTVREVTVHGADLALTRTYRFRAGSKSFSIHDEITNLGFAPTPLLLLYHFNIGYPVVDAGAELFAPAHKAVAFDEGSKSSVGKHLSVVEPSASAAVEVFELALAKSPARWVTAGIVNRGFGDGIGIGISYRLDQLPRLWEWRMLGEGRYLIGIEPSNCGLAGRAAERSAGTLSYLAPGERRAFDLVVTAATGAAVDRLPQGPGGDAR